MTPGFRKVFTDIIFRQACDNFDKPRIQKPMYDAAVGARVSKRVGFTTHALRVRQRVGVTFS
jgi:hypothetical protein